jgi:UDP-N-acetylmuramoyl-tripeptide--D-alanyl-D-alanine ligase
MSAPASLVARVWRRVRRQTVKAGQPIARFALLQAARLRRAQLRHTTFIAVTGSCGKTTSTRLIGALLTRNGACVVSDGKNTEKAAVRAVLSVPGSTRFCLQEVGADKKGTIARQVEILRPDIGIVMMVGSDHYKVFRTLEETAKEKGALVEGLPITGIAILNADDPNVRAMASRTKARIITFGLSTEAQVRGSDLSGAWPDRLSFTVAYGGQSIRVETCFPGTHWTGSVLAAIACGLACGFDLRACASAIKDVEPVFGRFSVHQVPAGPVFVLDSHKAPLWTVASTLAFVETATAPRKTVIFGTLSDYAGNARRTYRKVMRQALAIADRVIMVGPHASHGDNLRAEAGGRLFTFATTYDASRFVADESKADELILIKASGGDHLERIALSHFNEIMCWREACGKSGGCPLCRHYRTPSPPPLARAQAKQGKAVAVDNESFSPR